MLCLLSRLPTGRQCCSYFIPEVEQRMRDQLGQLESADQLVEPLRASFLFVSEAKKLFECGNPDEKRAIVQSVASNLLLKDKILLIEAKKPFAFFRERERFSTGCRGRGSNPHDLAIKGFSYSLQFSLPLNFKVCSLDFLFTISHDLGACH